MQDNVFSDVEKSNKHKNKIRKNLKIFEKILTQSKNCMKNRQKSPFFSKNGLFMEDYLLNNLFKKVLKMEFFPVSVKIFI